MRDWKEAKEIMEECAVKAGKIREEPDSPHAITLFIEIEFDILQLVGFLKQQKEGNV